MACQAARRQKQSREQRAESRENECEDCENRFPELGDGQAYFDCFLLCETQLRLAQTGILGLDWNVVVMVAVTMGIEIDKTFFKLLKAFEQAMLKAMK